MTNNTKYCPACQETKPISEFSRDRSKLDGRQARCKVCDRARVKRYRQTDNGRAAVKRYQQSERGREANRAACKRYRQTDNGRAAQARGDQKRYATKEGKQKQRARGAVNYAVKKKEMPAAQDCQCTRCGSAADQYHHYAGYDRDHWLDVEPVCTRCHAEIG